CSSVPTNNFNPKSEKQQILIYPNPNQGTFHVNLQGVDNPKISVYDVFGRVVNAQITLGSNQCIIEMGEALRGIYLLRIEDGGNAIMVGRYMVE
ncbi:MAG TPA: T9SS type A sorting domain-containing protein, partial [Saprospiraceae bacterium]|nr:T9SS type A sorting domain-containing protein [Saprospiraceae bacterium]